MTQDRTAGTAAVDPTHPHRARASAHTWPTLPRPLTQRTSTRPASKAAAVATHSFPTTPKITFRRHDKLFAEEPRSRTSMAVLARLDIALTVEKLTHRPTKSNAQHFPTRFGPEGPLERLALFQWRQIPSCKSSRAAPICGTVSDPSAVTLIRLFRLPAPALLRGRQQLAVLQRQPAARDPVDRPDAGRSHSSNKADERERHDPRRREQRSE